MERSTREGALSGTTTTVGEFDGDVWTPVTSPEHVSIAVAHWLDADSFVATAMTEGFARSDLLSCEVSTHTCTTVRAGDASALVLPTGYVSR